MIKVHVDTDPELKGPTEKTVSEIVSHVIKSENKSDADLSYIFGNDDLLNGLKKEFFYKDQFTDVIAFRLNDYEEENVEGEVYISLPRTKENAKKFNEHYSKELGRLIIHGSLHLLGYEDKTEPEKKMMTAKEDQYLDQVNWNQLYG